MIKFKIPIRTVSEANMTGEHWTKKSKRHKAQRVAVSLMFNAMPFYRKDPISLPCKIIMTRIAPRKLDIGDNLPMSLKTIRDEIAEHLTGETKAGRGDGDERLQFEYKQEKGLPKEYAVRIEIVPA